MHLCTRRDESRSLCLGVTSAFLLCVVCLAESFPLLNRLIKLAPYPTKASKVEMLRLLLLNVSLSYLANYFSTFFLRHDVWKARQQLDRTLKGPNASKPSAADEEETLLSEERAQNSAIVAVVCFLIFHFSMQIVLK